jgi:FtsP/CotA-like multicopper oxidase with cupredoxin domain
MQVTRRGFLAASGVAGAAALTLGLPRVPLAGNSATLVAATRQIEIDGKAATVYGLTGPDARPGLVIAAGQRFSATLENRLAEPTLVHWHGLAPPWRQDGVPDVSQAPLQPGARYTYDFPLARSGTFWMHSHLGLQEQRLFAAPLIVQGPEANSADEQEVVVLLHDFSFRPAEEILASLHATSGTLAGMDMSNTSAMGSMGGMTADINDFDHDAYLANDRTLADPEEVRVETGGKIRLRIINGAASTGFWIDLGAIEGELIAVDGEPVVPVAGRRFPVSMGQRLDIRFRLPAGRESHPILAMREGENARTGILLAPAGAPIVKLAAKAETRAPALDLALEERLRAAEPLAPRPADRRIEIDLAGNMQGYDWRMLEGGRSAAPAVKGGERVEILMRNRTMMAHPMHLHGHAFQVVAIEGRRLAGAMRDTVLVAPMGSLTIAFDADNPGRWAFHCHHLYHMASGMMSTLVYEGIA